MLYPSKALSGDVTHQWWNKGWLTWVPHDPGRIFIPVYTVKELYTVRETWLRWIKLVPRVSAGRHLAIDLLFDALQINFCVDLADDACAGRSSWRFRDHDVSGAWLRNWPGIGRNKPAKQSEKGTQDAGQLGGKVCVCVCESGASSLYCCAMFGASMMLLPIAAVIT